MSADLLNKMLSCPSANQDMEDVRVLGVVDFSSEKRQLLYLKGREAVNPNDLENIPKALVGQVLRLSAKCENGRCAQFSDGRCSLGSRVTQMLSDVVTELPSCSIRNTCRWFAEQGAPVCFKCPQVVTSVPDENAILSQVAYPPAMK